MITSKEFEQKLIEYFGSKGSKYKQGATMDKPISSNLPHGIRMRANNLQFYEQVFNSNSKPKSVYELVQVLHDTKRAAGMEPKGWIIGEAVLEQLKKEYEDAVGFHVFCHVPPQIMGLQFFVDTETPNRLELIS